MFYGRERKEFLETRVLPPVRDHGSGSLAEKCSFRRFPREKCEFKIIYWPHYAWFPEGVRSAESGTTLPASQIHAAHQRFQQETVAPESRCRASLCLLQYVQSPFFAESYTRDGSGNRRPRMGDGANW